MTAGPNYKPNTRDAKGMQSFDRPAMSVMRDVCSIPRTRGKHGRCAKIRQAAGFTTTQGGQADHQAPNMNTNLPPSKARSPHHGTCKRVS